MREGNFFQALTFFLLLLIGDRTPNYQASFQKLNPENDL